MDNAQLLLLSETAAAIAWLHTLAGPDHYLPFIALACAGSWSRARTILVTTLCGIAHVLSSVCLGGIGLGAGWALGGMQAFEGSRGALAGWLLAGFGAVYLIWGIRQSMRSRPHAHSARSAAPASTTWVLFLIFAFGPCEPLIPLLMVPAAAHSVAGTAIVAGVFGVITIATMLTLVVLAQRGIARLHGHRLERHAHAAAGLALTACGLMITLGF